MNSKLLKILDIEPKHASRVFLMLGMGFFMGIFLATYSVSASALFLVTFPEELPTAILLSGTTGLILTAIYNFLQSRIHFRFLSILTLIFVVALVGSLQFIAPYLPDPDYVYYAAFVLMLPLNYITLLIFWGTFGRIFSLRESKKIIGNIDTGQLLASMLALFSIPFFQGYEGTETEDLFIISLIAAGGVLIMNIVVASSGHYHAKKKTGRISYFKMLKSRYILLMSGFVILSVLALTFVDFAFLRSASQQFDENNLPNFLALFEATVVIFSFLFQTFVTDRVISLYGLRFALIVNPILAAAFTIVAVVIGTFFGFIKDGNSTFIFFFIIIAMSKLFIASLKDALDGPTFKLYFLPVDSDIRFDVQTKVEGVVYAFAGLLAGGLFLLIESVEFFTLIYITIFTLPLLAMWYLITNRMHSGYKDTLQDTLVRNKESKNIQVREEFAVNQVLENEIKSNSSPNIIYCLKLMEKLEPALFENSIIKMLNNSNEEVRDYAKNKIEGLNLQYEKDSEIHQLAMQALGSAEDKEVLSVTPKQLEKLGKSVNKQDRTTAARLLRTNSDQKNIFLLLELLRDIDPDVRLEAIIAARKVKRPETWTVLIDMTDSPTFGHAATSALIEAGEDALEALEMAFHKSGQRDAVMMKIIAIIGRIGGNVAIDSLWQKIDYPDKRIASQVMIWLRYFNYNATRERERNAITELLDDDISKAIWNISAIEELPNTEQFAYLQKALEEELEINYDHIFMLLSILYDMESIRLVRENIETGTSEGIAFALELLDIFIDKDIRPRLFPLFDDIDPIDKLRQLQIYYPREEYTEREVLNYILNRNFDQANRWTKSCALHAMAFTDDFKVTKAMVAQLFNSDYLLQETASWVIYHKERTIFEKVTKRLPEEDKKYLEESISKNQLIEGLDDGAFLRIEMAMLMKNIPVLSGIKGAMLCDLTDKMHIIQLTDGEEYDLDTKFESKPVLVVAEGTAELHFKNGEMTNLNPMDVFGELFVVDTEIDSKKLIGTSSNVVVFSIASNDYYSIMGDNHILVQDMIASVSSKLEREIN